MRRFRATFIFLVAPLLGYAQGAAFLNIPSDAASMALGGAGVALDADAFALENNVASAALSHGSTFALAYSLWQPKGLRSDNLALGGVSAIGRSTSLCIGADLFKGAKYQAFDENGVPSSFFSPRDMALSAGISQRITDKFSLGVKGTFFSSEPAQSHTATGVVFGAALIYRTGHFSLGASIDNLGSGIDYGYIKYHTPLAVSVGGAYRYGGLLATVQADWYPSSSLEESLGLQYTFIETVSLRAGYHHGGHASAFPDFFSFGLGVEAGPVDISAVCLAAGRQNPLRGTLAFNLSFSF